jgi:hypothetical protein
MASIVNVIINATANPAAEQITGYEALEGTVIVGTAPALPLTVANVTPGPHTYTLRAKNAIMIGPVSSPVNVTVPAPVTAPTNVSITITVTVS